MPRATPVSYTHLILSALFLILFEETGQSNLSVGMRVSNRYQKEWNSIVGCFLEKSMICGTINPECLLKDYLTEMQRNLMEAMDCADVYKRQVLIFPFILGRFMCFLKNKRNCIPWPMPLWIEVEHGPIKRLMKGQTRCRSSW